MPSERLWDRHDCSNSKMNRRSFLKLGAFSTAAYAVGSAVPSGVWAHNKASKSLAFYNLHTEETLAVTYCRNRHYLNNSLEQINYILRDHRTGEVAPIDPRVLDLLYAIRKSLRLKSNHPFHVISGYRSPATNNMLRKNSSGVAKRSYHMLGQAIDVRLPGLDTKQLKKAAIAMKSGGVDYYASSDFVHLDVGRVRYW